MPLRLLRYCLEELTNQPGLCVTTSIKKTCLAKKDIVSYRHISILSFISSVLDKVVANRFRSQIYTSDLSNVLQSAYKLFHSTESALLEIGNDISLNIDNGKATALTLLALSVTFDTVDHDILIKRLSKWYALSGAVLTCLSSYLTDRRYMLPTSCDIPQRSVFCKSCFTLFTTLLR